MMSGARVGRPNAVSKKIFFPAEDDRGVVDSINLSPEKLKGYLSGQALVVVSV